MVLRLNQCYLLFAFTLLFGNANCQTKAFVWNLLGTEIKEAPSLDSKTISTIAFGDTVMRAHFTRSTPHVTDTLSIIGGYPNSSHWTMVDFNHGIGWVFESNISNDSVPTIREYGFTKIDYLSLLGDSVGDTVIVEKKMIGVHELTSETSIKYFQNGSYEYTAFDGCFDHTYIFTKIDFKEILHVAMSMYSIKVNEEIHTPEFLKTEADIIIFIGTEATVEVVISKTKNGWKIFSYDCT